MQHNLMKLTHRTLIHKGMSQKKMQLFVVLLTIAVMSVLTIGIAFADTPEAMDNALNIVRSVASIICIILGAIYLVNGIIKYAQAHADDNGAQEKKAANTLATAIVLIAVGIFLQTFPFSDVISGMGEISSE